MTTEERHENFPSTIRVVGLKIRDRGEVRKVGAGNATLRLGDHVILEVDDGDLAYGVVYLEPHPMPFIPPMRVMNTILRPANEGDMALIREHERIAKEGKAYCQERATAHGLKMKVVEVYRSFNRRETRFLYTSEDRVDFRQLVKELARRFGGRIEMRHIGPREEAQRMGGVDSCGLVLCCASFLTDLRPIKAKQAKAHGLPMEEGRLLGVCGRLKCCLAFESMEPRDATGGGTPGSPLIHPSPSSSSTSPHRPRSS
ncbi:MAG: regulatory iron-sulfur-containing complex subunit RicT [candidate division NC10 bacterium]